jgi:NADPH-dependent curcumin reductase CurA
MSANRRFLLRSRPQAQVGAEHFEWHAAPVPALEANQALARTLFLSVDPAMRSWMDDKHSYMPPIRVGEVIRAGGLSVIVESRLAGFPEGTLVLGMCGWQDYCVISTQTERFFRRLPPGLPVSLATLTVAAGSSALSAYFGVREIARPQPGETMVVTAAAGAAGSMAGQMGAIFGARVVGVCGSDEKAKWLTETLGFAAAVNYRDRQWETALQSACGRGVDILFDNTGGPVTLALLPRMTPHGRLVLNGMIASYNGEPALQIPAAPVLMRRLRVEGVLATDYLDRQDEALRQMVRWIDEGRLVCAETVVDGLERLPEALAMLFSGGNRGKLLVMADAAAVRRYETATPRESVAAGQTG